MKLSRIILYKIIIFIVCFIISMMCLVLMSYAISRPNAETIDLAFQFKMLIILMTGAWGLPILLLIALQSLDKKGK